jgi:PPOX class probable F420-dependent enzyme
VARDGNELIVWTQTDAGKVKRIRNNGAVELAECDARGKPRGARVKGNARILDAEGTQHGRSVLTKKYGISGRVVIGVSSLIRGRGGTVCIAITIEE